jgi:predicted transposase/invertase (TIGR01784 family)
MPKLLSPTLDVVFKMLFADPRNHELLLSLLGAVLRPPSPIADATVLNAEVPKDAVGDKGLVLDVAVDLADGSRVDVEMQADVRPGLRRRALLYWARLYDSQIGRGGDYRRLRPTVSVFFLGERLLRGSRFHSTFRVLEVHDQEVFSEAFELHVVELPKLGAIEEAEQSEEQKLVGWGRFLAVRTRKELEELDMNDPMIEKAKEALERLSMDPQAQELARVRELARWTHAFELDAAREEGEARGEARGRAEGILAVLEARRIPVPDAVRERVRACADLATLDRWLARAATCASAEQVVEPG